MDCTTCYLGRHSIRRGEVGVDLVVPQFIMIGDHCRRRSSRESHIHCMIPEFHCNVRNGVASF